MEQILFFRVAPFQKGLVCKKRKQEVAKDAALVKNGEKFTKRIQPT